MRRFCLVSCALAAIALAGCTPEPTPEQKAAADARAVAEVKAAQTPPPVTIVPEPITFADVERENLFGAGCNFRPAGMQESYVFLGKADSAAMKISGDLVRFAPDKGSAQNPLGSWRKYDGKEHSAVLELTSGTGTESGTETVDFPARLTVRDGKSQIVYESEGAAQCGS